MFKLFISPEFCKYKWDVYSRKKKKKKETRKIVCVCVCVCVCTFWYFNNETQSVKPLVLTGNMHTFSHKHAHIHSCSHTVAIESCQSETSPSTGICTWRQLQDFTPSQLFDIIPHLQILSFCPTATLTSLLPSMHTQCTPAAKPFNGKEKKH